MVEYYKNLVTGACLKYSFNNVYKLIWYYNLYNFQKDHLMKKRGWGMDAKEQEYKIPDNLIYPIH